MDFQSGQRVVRQAGLARRADRRRTRSASLSLKEACPPAGDGGGLWRASKHRLGVWGEERNVRKSPLEINWFFICWKQVEKEREPVSGRVTGHPRRFSGALVAKGIIYGCRPGRIAVSSGVK